MRIAHPIFAAVLLVALSTSGAWGQEAVAEKVRLDSDFQHGKAALLEGRYADAKDYLERAEKHVGTNSAEINAGIAIAELRLGQYSAARRREMTVLGLVSNDHARAEAHNVMGMAWMRESLQNGKDSDQLHAAEQSFEEALKADPRFATVYFNLGEVLRYLGRESDAAAAFKNFVRVAADDPLLTQDQPLQRQARAPDFSGVDSQGATVSSASQRGRVMLLDFWATWCPPCIRALPVMRELAHYFPPGEFVLISIDEDSSEQGKWRSFIAKEKMDWAQVWDQNSKIFSSFDLAPHGELSLPRYVLLDREGYVLRVYSGTDRVGSIAGQAVKAVQNSRHSAPREPE
jgi:tetratricopeptide (TPR) repeat protein